MAAIPLSGILGSLVSGVLLDLDGWMGVAGWQWLFILEAAPAVLLGVAFWYTMTDWPSQAHWLTTEQRDWLKARLDSERSRRQTIRHYSLTQALTNSRCLCSAWPISVARSTRWATWAGSSARTRSDWMRAIPPAAAVPDSIAVGRLQKTGAVEARPIAAITSIIMVSTGSVISPVAINPAAVQNKPTRHDGDARPCDRSDGPTTS
jgi:MFS family permease